MSNVQISEELFSRLCAYFIMDRREPLQEQIIKDLLQEKLDLHTAPGQTISPERNRAMNSPARKFNQQRFLHFIYIKIY